MTLSRSLTLEQLFHEMMDTINIGIFVKELKDVCNAV